MGTIGFCWYVCWYFIGPAPQAGRQTWALSAIFDSYLRTSLLPTDVHRHPKSREIQGLRPFHRPIKSNAANKHASKGAEPPAITVQPHSERISLPDQEIPNCILYARAERNQIQPLRFWSSPNRISYLTSILLQTIYQNLMSPKYKAR